MRISKRILFQSPTRIRRIVYVLLIFLPAIGFSQKSDLFPKQQFQTVIDAHKGKVIYLEFWASWCAPCIKQLKHTRKLQENYKEKDVVFIYLSIDTDQEKWIKASKKLKIDDYEYNLLTQRFLLSDNLKSLDIKSIPHYVIINKQGTIVAPNAPNPDTKEVIIKLDYYLNE